MRRKIVVAFTMLTLLLFPSVNVSAVELSSEQSGAISQNCQSIKQSLKNLQKTDSRTRVYLGSIYQTILTDFITPLNLRLVRNNIPDGDLVDDQSTITSARDKFARDFITYSQSLEELIAIDCQNHPADFYNKLEDTREKRSVVASDVYKLQQLVTDHINSVIKLKEESYAI